MTLPNISTLNISTLNISTLYISTSSNKRPREFGTSSESEDDQDRRNFDIDKSKWREMVCKIWDGPTNSWRKNSFSPDGDWKKRTFEVRAELSTSRFFGGVSCIVVQNVHGFDPNGVHFADMEEVKHLLKKHYPHQVVFSNLPTGSATKSDIEAWVKMLPLPDWYLSFEDWKKDIKQHAWHRKQTVALEGTGKITYPVQNMVYVGETAAGSGIMEGIAQVPHGRGIMTYANGSFWQGRWKNGIPTSHLGVFTDANNKPTVGRWTTTMQHFKSSTEIARDELQKWKDAHRKVKFTDDFLVEKPGYGTIAVADGHVGGVLRKASWHTETAIARMFATTNPFELGTGRDTDDYMREGERYTKLIPLAVFDVDYANSQVLREWEQYQGRLQDTINKNASLGKKAIVSGFKNVTRMDLAHPEHGYKTSDGQLIDSSLATMGVPLSSEVNEKFLLHATAPENLFAILNTSFDITYSSYGMLGSGLYFADDPGKSDQYATAVSCDSDIARRLGLYRTHILDTLRQNAAIPEHQQESGENRSDYDIFFMFVSRIALGIVAQPDDIAAFNENKLPKEDSRSKDVHNKLFTDTTDNMMTAQELTEPYGSLSILNVLRYREFVVYKNAVARASQLVVYCRARQRTTGEGDFSGEMKKELLEEDGTAKREDEFEYEDPFKYEEPDRVD